MAGAIAAHAARQRRQRLEQEEEIMTPYTPQDLEGWEFKIIRGNFRDPDFMEAVLVAEALAGWELVEKFDDNRLRLKRPVDARRKDASLPEEADPYRTQYGPTENQTTLIIVGATIALFSVAGLLALLFFENATDWPIFTLIVAIILGLLGIVIARLRRAGG